MQAGALKRIVAGNCRRIHPVALRSLLRRGLVGKTILGELVVTEKGKRELERYSRK